MDRCLIELIEQHSWTEGIRYLMTRDRRMLVQPWPYCRYQHFTWI
jgi:hypothetical protein